MEAAASKPDKPIFVLKAYAVQSSLSKLIRHIYTTSGCVVPGGVQWGLANNDAEVSEGWRDELMEFYRYGGPATSYDIIVVPKLKTKRKGKQQTFLLFLCLKDLSFLLGLFSMKVQRMNAQRMSDSEE